MMREASPPVHSLVVTFWQASGSILLSWGGRMER